MDTRFHRTPYPPLWGYHRAHAYNHAVRTAGLHCAFNLFLSKRGMFNIDKTESKRPVESKQLFLSLGGVEVGSKEVNLRPEEWGDTLWRLLKLLCISLSIILNACWNFRTVCVYGFVCETMIGLIWLKLICHLVCARSIELLSVGSI